MAHGFSVWSNTKRTPHLNRTRVGSVICLISLAVTSVSATSLVRAAPQTVRVGVYQNAPKVIVDEQGRVSGIFIELLKVIAEREGWELEFVPGSWQECLRRLETSEIDLLPDVALSPERADRFDFNQIPVTSDWLEIYAPTRHPIKSFTDLSGKRVAILDGSIQYDVFARLIEEMGLVCELKPVTSNAEVFESIVRGEADAGVVNRFFGLAQHRRYRLQESPILFFPTALFFAAPKGLNADLLSAIDENLDLLKRDTGSIYYQLLEEWIREAGSRTLPRGVIPAVGILLGLLLLTGGFVLLLRSRVRIATRELRKTEGKYRELVENANSIILHWTRDGRIIFLNEFGQHFFGYTAAEIVGRHVIGTIVPENESGGRDLRPLMDEICANPAAFEQNINENVRRNGERVWIAWTNKVVLDQWGDVAEILSIGLDITARKRIEEELRATQAGLERRVIERTAELAVARDRAEAADRTKSAFLATMSHELRTPLNSIIGFTGLMLQGLAGPLNDEQTKQLKIVKDSGQHLLALINGVLDISKIEAGQIEIQCAPFDIAESIHKVVQTVKPLADKKKLPLIMQISSDVSRITSDRQRVEQVLLNLLSNAIKFTEHGGITVTAEAVNGTVRIAVTDTGMGIRPEDIGKLFQPFHQLDTGLTRRHEGTGLGLAICKRLIERLGGEIRVASEWSKGSTFSFVLPVTPEGIS
jgi:PAS domain S-box-containing protein